MCIVSVFLVMSCSFCNFRAARVNSLNTFKTSFTFWRSIAEGKQALIVKLGANLAKDSFSEAYRRRTSLKMLNKLEQDTHSNPA